MKKILILGAGEYQLPLIEQAKKDGYYVIVASIPGAYPGFAKADKACYVDVTDREGVLALAKDEAVDGVVTDQTDLAVGTIDYVTRQLGLPGYGDEDCIRYFTDKNAMRQKCCQLGIPTIPSYEVETLEQAQEVFAQLGGEGIIKPPDSQGSRGVCRVKNAAELAEKFPQALAYSREKRVIVEKFIDGQELEIDTMVVDGQVHFITDGDITPFGLPDVFSASRRLYPSCQPEPVRQALRSQNEQIIRGFGLQRGLTHGEYIVDRDGQVYLIEIAARGGGNFISSHIQNLVAGVHNEEFLLTAATTRQLCQPHVRFTGKVVCYICFYLPEGEVVRADGLKTAAALPFVKVESASGIRVGDRQKANHDKTSRYTYVLEADHMDQLEQRICQVRGTVQVQVERGGVRYGPIWE